MKITFVCPRPDMSGGNRVIAIYAERLAKSGHKVVVVSPPAQGTSLWCKFISLVKGRGWPLECHAHSHFDGPHTFEYHVVKQSRAIMEKDIPDADVVIATWWQTAEWVSKFSASKGAKVYFVQHHEIFPHLPIERCHATYRLPMHKIVVARWLVDVMRQLYGAHQVSLVPNNVDRKQFFASPREKQTRPTVGFLYHTAAFKRVDVAIDVIRRVQIAIPDLRIVAFGHTYPTSALPLPIGAEFTENPPQTTIKDIYSKCDVWLSASQVEGFNLPAMEAMACRTPVVCTKTGWPAESIRDGFNGWLADIDDGYNLAQHVIRVLRYSSHEWKQMSENAYQTASVGSWEESTKLFESALVCAIIRAENEMGSYGGTNIAKNK